MHITGIGIDAGGSHIRGKLEQLAASLAFFRQCGFDAVELSAPGLDVILGGRLYPPQVERVRSII